MPHDRDPAPDVPGRRRDGTPTPFDRAAADCVAIVRADPRGDGDRHAGYLAAYVCLTLAGYDIDPAPAEIATILHGIAAGTLGTADVSRWLAAMAWPRPA